MTSSIHPHYFAVYIFIYLCLNIKRTIKLQHPCTWWVSTIRGSISNVLLCFHSSVLSVTDNRSITISRSTSPHPHSWLPRHGYVYIMTWLVLTIASVRDVDIYIIYSFVTRFQQLQYFDCFDACFIIIVIKLLIIT